MNIHFEHGSISKNVRIQDAVIRTVDELDEFGDFPVEKIKLQARLMNQSETYLENVKCDVSYYAVDGSFLGLDLTDSLELDELDPMEVIPVDLELQMPEDTERCVLNVHSRRVRTGAEEEARATANQENPNSGLSN